MPKFKIHKAIIRGKLRLIEFFCKSGIDLNQPDLEGYSPLHLAVIHNKPKVVKMLLDFDASVSILDKKNKNPLDTAIILGKSNIVKVFVQSLGLENIVKVHANSTPMHLAVLHNRINVIKTLIKFGASVDAVDLYGNTPLHIAAIRGSFGVVKYLLEYGANPSCYNHGKNTALHLAVLAKKKNIVEILIEYKGLVNAVDKRSLTPLHIAAMKNQSDIVRTLISSGADTELPEEDCNTPLHLAVLYGCLEAVEVLILSGAKINSRNLIGETPLHMAVITGNIKIVERLIQGSAEVNFTDDYDLSPLEIALRLCNAKITDQLFQAGSLIPYKTGEIDFLLRCCEVTFIEVYKSLKEVKSVSLENYCVKLKDVDYVKRLSKYDVSVSNLFETLKIFIKYEVLLFGEKSEIYRKTLSQQKSDLHPSILLYTEDCFKEVLSMQKVIIPFSSFDHLMKDLSIYKAITLPDREKLLHHPFFAQYCIKHILDVGNIDTYPIYRDLIVSRVKKTLLKQELLKHVFYTRRENCEKKILMDVGSLSLVAEKLPNIDILNLILAIQNLNISS